MENDYCKETAEFLAKEAGCNKLITRYAGCNNYRCTSNASVLPAKGERGLIKIA